MGNRNRNSSCNSWERPLLLSQTNAAYGRLDNVTQNPENVGQSKSDLSRISSLDNPPYWVANGKHNPLWQEHRKPPRINVKQQKWSHHLLTLNTQYSLQTQTSLSSSLKSKLPRWKTLQQLWNYLFVGIHIWPKGQPVCACNTTQHHKNSFPPDQKDQHLRLIINQSLEDRLLKCQCFNQAQKDNKERIP